MTAISLSTFFSIEILVDKNSLLMIFMATLAPESL
jgi:hypothetical protein